MSNMPSRRHDFFPDWLIPNGWYYVYRRFPQSQVEPTATSLNREPYRISEKESFDRLWVLVANKDCKMSEDCMFLCRFLMWWSLRLSWNPCCFWNLPERCWAAARREVVCLWLKLQRWAESMFRSDCKNGWLQPLSSALQEREWVLRDLFFSFWQRSVWEGAREWLEVPILAFY